eukprot:m.341340 g.341340  ORF g.341340 m.341340 type:complete len:110 (+) comp20029_c0_seq1:186-515(+)
MSHSLAKQKQQQPQKLQAGELRTAVGTLLPAVLHVITDLQSSQSNINSSVQNLNAKLEACRKMVTDLKDDSPEDELRSQLTILQARLEERIKLQEECNSLELWKRYSRD